MSHTEPRNVVDILVSMVSIDSVNPWIGGEQGGESRLADYLAFVATHLGFSPRRLPVGDRGENLLVVYERGGDRPWTLFDSHMDTVGVERMVGDPFGAVIRDGRLWGRGACDTKGSGAAMLWALHDYAELPEQPNNIAILYTIDEEVGMRGIRTFLDNDYYALGMGSPGIVIGEPTGLRLVTAHNGICRMRVTTRGVAVHASNPPAGKSAISSMVKVVQAFEQEYIAALDESHPLTGTARCSINTIRGGTASNVIADRCEIEIDRRMVPGEDPNTVVSVMRATLDEIARRDPEIDLESEVLFLAPPLAPQADSHLAVAAARALSGEGLDASPHGVTYATNGGDTSSRGVDTVVFGPGDIAQAHTRDEWIDLDELERSVAVYRAIMASE